MKYILLLCLWLASNTGCAPFVDTIVNAAAPPCCNKLHHTRRPCKSNARSNQRLC
ncbi:MAG: hypothetical protein HY741_05980 [Chloroflexi bacterium]|nr:hypothetical protein [Chloroflexota bacterium]